MRSIWAGVISFGLVVIPVKLYTATEQRDVSFRQVHREDGGRIQFKRVCSIDGQEVPYSDVAKGYELATGDVVVLTDDDLKDLPLATAHRIDVQHFAPSGQLDPILANKAYYLEPEPAGVRAYVLFRDALERSGRVAVAKVAIRQREALAALRVRDGVLVLETLLWPDEVRTPDFKFLDEDVEVRSQELKMAASLIDTMTEDFDPARTRTRTGRRSRRSYRPRSRATSWSARPAPRISAEQARRPRRPHRDAARERRPRRRPTGRRTGGEPGDGKAAPAQPLVFPPEGERVTGPIPHWPGRMVSLAAGEQVYVAETPRSVQDKNKELVLCVHGMSGAATNWTDFMGELAPDFACAAVDLPGSGFSPPPAAKRGYSITALAGTVIRLIEALDRGPVHLAGNSMGGAVSIRVAASRPDLLRTLTLVSPVLPDLLIRPELLRFPLAGLPFVGDWVMRRTQRVPAENRVAGVVATCYNDPAAMHPDRFCA